jgi:hypothetical protein
MSETKQNIEELADIAQQIKVSWQKANNYYRTFTTILLETKRKFAGNPYGSEWTFDNWLLWKTGLIEDQVLRQLNNHLKIIAAAERQEIERENYRIDAQKRRERAAAASEKRVAAEHARRERQRLKDEREAEAAKKRAEREAEAAKKCAPGQLRKQSTRILARPGKNPVTNALRAHCQDGVERYASEFAEIIGHPETDVVKALDNMLGRKDSNRGYRIEKRTIGSKVLYRLSTAPNATPLVLKPKAAPPPQLEHPQLTTLLMKSQSLEKTNRVQLGECYAAMKRIVENGEAGNCPDTGKPWTWEQWSKAYIKRSRVDIYKCIQEFVASCNNSQSENVHILHPNVA